MANSQCSLVKLLILCACIYLAQTLILLVGRWTDVTVTSPRRTNEKRGHVDGPIRGVRGIESADSLVEGLTYSFYSEDDPEVNPIVPVRDYFRLRDHVINGYQFEYDVAPPRCENETFLLIMVMSLHENFSFRRAIRDTWGSIAQYHKRIRLVFLIGQNQDQYWNANVRKEASTFRDILVTNIHESYQNLTLKVMSGFQWATRACPTQYLLKSDEDMIINVPFLVSELISNPVRNAIIGSVNKKAHVFRNSRSKWGVSRDVYPYATYPPYMSGNSYVVSRLAVGKITHGFRYVPLVSIEDAYITGILAWIVNITLIADQRYTYWGSPGVTVCDLVLNRMITGTHMTPKLMYSMWKAMRKAVCR